MPTRADPVYKFVFNVKKRHPDLSALISFLAVKAFFDAMAPFFGKIGKADTTTVEVVSMGDHASLVTTDITYDKEGKFMSNNK